MNPIIQSLLEQIQQNETLSPEDKTKISAHLKDIDKSLTIAEFKLDRTEKVKRTTAILLEETIAELESKRKAVEDQNKELEIEAALERVRSKALAMHTSEDLAITVDSFFTELKELGVTARRCGVGIIDPETRIVHLTATTATQQSDRQKVDGHLKLAGHPILDKIFESWIAQEEYHPVLVGNEILEYYKVMNPQVTFPDFADDATQYGYYFFFKEGGVFTWTDKALSEHHLQIFRRYTSVLSLTHRRYMDLKEAEAQAKEATKQASLDRVRGEIASMRSKEDLQRITPLVWNELTTLDVPSIRCGVFIMDEEHKDVKVFLSAPDGHSLAMMVLPFNANPITANTTKSWLKNQVYTEHWTKDQFINWMTSMVDQGFIESTQAYQDSTAPPESLYLHFVPFKQGMLYVGNTEELTPDHIDLVKSLAEAFSIAYARYDDFVRLENAKQSIESALTELKATQSQLIQSEKMASLGELTAGIAHEIQNPLNFVNNFSEVSHELMDEMKEELDAGNYADAKEIADSVKQNLEKISHHGKRADGIVKGMLQHSRTGSGTKEPTDINALTDEYLRLAYHGLRAKDNSFNAELVTDYDPKIKKINVVTQDMGRVILNLITNAFYAVNERKKLSVDGYKPTVTIKTKLVKPPFREGHSPQAEDLGGLGVNHVEISVTDNGPGIPQKVLDKVFQPFFTTKPTGQGTGLGLSLAYDIVKAHGGELTVDTIEGKGTTFTIQLPFQIS